jgi:hypothetical protein
MRGCEEIVCEEDLLVYPTSSISLLLSTWLMLTACCSSSRNGSGADESPRARAKRAEVNTRLNSRCREWSIARSASAGEG